MDKILAVKIFSILVNSMPDERTNSTITWLNSPIRGNQTTQTVVDMIQVGQWYGKHLQVNLQLDGKESKKTILVTLRKINWSRLDHVIDLQ
jgi:hypothetical protein